MTQPRDPRSFLPLTPLAFQVLLALADGERHGYAIIREVDERTDGLIRLRTGTLYTLLQRLLEEELLELRGTPTGGGVQEAQPFREASALGGVQGAPPLREESARERRGAMGTPQASALGGVQGAPPPKEDPRRKYYGLTELGRGVLSAEATRLQALVSEAQRKHVLGRESKV